MSYRRDLEKLARALGFLIERTNGGHLRLRHPQCRGIVHTSLTPSHPTRNLKNARAQMLRLLRSGGSSGCTS